MFYWLKELLFWKQSDTVTKGRLNSVLQQKRNHSQKLSWSMVISDEDDDAFWTKILTTNLLKITIDKDKKQITLVNHFSREKAWQTRGTGGGFETMVLPFHSEMIYLPEFPLPQTQENEKYALIRQNLQQTIELETGVKFIDTQQFLLEYGSVLGMFASPQDNFYKWTILGLLAAVSIFGLIYLFNN